MFPICIRFKIKSENLNENMKINNHVYKYNKTFIFKLTL